MTKPIAIITDFGVEDWYVASLHGAILNLNLQIPIVDINHSITSGNISEAAFVLSNGYPIFPQGTVFLVVVDPGVGGARKPVALSAGGYFFVGPDNGVFTPILDSHPDCTTREIKLDWAQKISATFHGRDIFAPCAAALATLKPFSETGPVIQRPVRLEPSQPIFKKNTIYGKILYIDKFGNCLTNIRSDHLKEANLKTLTALLKSGRQAAFRNYYSESPVGQPLCLLGSGDWLEISINQGHANIELGLTVGEEIIISFE